MLLIISKGCPAFAGPPSIILIIIRINIIVLIINTKHNNNNTSNKNTNNNTTNNNSSELAHLKFRSSVRPCSVYVYLSLSLSLYIYIYMCVYVCMCMYVYVYVCVYIYIYMIYLYESRLPFAGTHAARDLFAGSLVFRCLLISVSPRRYFGVCICIDRDPYILYYIS